MVTEWRWIWGCKIRLCSVGSGLMHATVLETGQNKNVEQGLTHSLPPTPHPQAG